MAGGITVHFEVWNPFPGNERPTFAVVGSCKHLGWWNPNRALIAEPIDEDKRMWRASVLVPRWFNQIEFQWIALDPVTKAVIKWEQCPVRVLPLRQDNEKISCWFESRASIVKVLPVNKLESEEWKRRNLQRCIEDIKIYRVHDLNVDIKYEYYTADVTEENQGIRDGHGSVKDKLGERLGQNGGNVRMIDELNYNCNEASGFPLEQCQISRVGGDIIADKMSPGGAAEEGGIRREVRRTRFRRRVFSLKSVLTAGLVIGAAMAARHYFKSL